MITRTYISKINTIIKDSDINTGINPVSELCYGANVTRMLLYFDHSKIKKMVDDKIFPDLGKLKHTLKIKNAGSMDFTKIHCGETSSISDNVKLRASSFDLIFFLIPKEWDCGKGFDYTYTFFNQGYFGKECEGTEINSSKMLSRDGSNWFNRMSGNPWDEAGVFSNTTLSIEYNKFSSTNEESKIVIGRQHFDVGNENINIDITDIFNKFILGDVENYGIGIAYAPELERTEAKVDNYTGFLTNKTNTFFEPFVETEYCDSISDDRANFPLDKSNRLYLYCNIGGSTDNLDELPTCDVDGKEYEVKQYSKGIYYIDITLSRAIYKPNTMLYDTWDNIIYKGVKLDPVELEFVVKSNSIYFNIGNKLEENVKLYPTVYGIDSDETIKRGDIRKIVVNPIVKYRKNISELVDSMSYRLYVKDGEREIDIIPYENVNKTYLENYFLIDTSILIPNKYYVDIKINYNMEMIIHHNVLSFDIVNDLNNKYA